MVVLKRRLAPLSVRLQAPALVPTMPLLHQVLLEYLHNSTLDFLLQIPQRFLMGPGPANSHPRILAAQTLPLLGHM
jgi:hypothetical protein